MTIHDPIDTPKPRRTIELWRHTVHILTAHLMIDLCERRLRVVPRAEEIGEIYAIAIVATAPDRSVLAATVGRSRHDETAVAALDRALAATARTSASPDAFWKLSDDPLIVVTDDRPPFTSRRFRRAVMDLGCEHRLRRSER